MQSKYQSWFALYEQTEMKQIISVVYIGFNTSNEGWIHMATKST